jgi:hypothetical protein
MNNFKKLLTATVLISASSLANASALYINAPSNMGTDGSVIGDTNTATDLFSTITLAPLSPTSTYIDLNGNGLVDTGEYVFDTGSTTVTGFGYNNSAIADNEGLALFWDLDVSWTLFGAAGVSGDGTFDNSDPAEILGAQFFGGSLVFDLIDNVGASSIMNAITINITGSAVSFGSSIGFSLFGDLISSAPGVLFDEDDTDLSATLNMSGDPGTFISMKAVTDLQGLEQQPTDQGGTFGALSAAIKSIFNGLPTGVISDDTVLLSRTTTVGSVDISQVPEPTSLALLGLGLLGFAGAARKRKAK